jgi:hypothetical protein
MIVTSNEILEVEMVESIRSDRGDLRVRVAFRVLASVLAILAAQPLAAAFSTAIDVAAMEPASSG